ncbi:DUF2339 domain-containing protein [Planktotalea sp.]|uniref:DUF2339 domain-containing protein n=1 Tax=Planktotalea sp. TaxID=2029877 RepID=UPI003F6CF570
MFILIAILVGIAILLAPIGVLSLSRKVRELSARIDQLEQAASGSPENTNIDKVGPWVAPDIERALATPSSNDALIEVDAPAPSVETVVTSDTQEKPTPRSFVFRADLFANALNWLKDNWFLGIAAISLALAGIFMVQYGVEQGLLTPFARIMGALALGAAFVILGEVARRRFGDDSGTMQALPSTFSGAGIVTLFAAVLSARHLYDMLPSDLTLFALVGVAVLAVVLGWFYGPFLAAIGVIGALAAPFAVGGSSDAPQLFFYYFALIVVMALAIDRVRRWAWVSVLALIGGFIATWMLLISGAQNVHALAFGFITVVAATALPVRRIWPDHSGSMVSSVVLKTLGKGSFNWPDFPTRLAAGTFIAAMVLSFLAPLEAGQSLEGWLGIWSVFALGCLALVWMWRAKALQDLSALAPIALLALIIVLALERVSIFQDFTEIKLADRLEGAVLPHAASLFSGMFAVFAALGFWRVSQGVRGSLIWIAASAFALPLALGALEIFWTPSVYIGAYPWAGHAITGAALMTVLAERSAKRWPEDMRPAALFAMSALSLMSFALMLILSTAALSIAIAVMIVIAALIDRRFDMAWLGLFIQLCVAVLGWRFLIDPGVPWASWWNTPLWEVVLGFVVPLALMGMAWWILRPITRIGAQLALESAIWSFGAVFVLILLERSLRGDIDSFWGLSLAGSVLLISMGAQLYRLRVPSRLGFVRIGLATLLGVLAFGTLLFALVFQSPLTWRSSNDIHGPLLMDTIAIAYLVPAFVLGVLVWKLDHINRNLRGAFASLSAALIMAYVGFEIRRFWQGFEIASNSVSQGELYSYTIAMMLASVGLLFFAFARRSLLLRKLAMAGIAVTIAKVFLIDMSGLMGLIRVASFLGLGLALSGLAWLSRAMSARWELADPSQTQNRSELGPSSST